MDTFKIRRKIWINIRFIKKIWNKIPLSDYWRWKVTTILVKLTMPLLQGSEILDAYKREEQWQNKKVKPFHGDAFPILPAQYKKDIYIWAVIDWHYRKQRPQHIALELSKRGYRVFYISTTFVNDSSAGFELEPLNESNSIVNVRLHLKNRPTVYQSASDEKNKSRLLRSVIKLLEWTNSTSIISIIQHPFWVSVVEKIPNSRIIYDCMDHHEGFANTGQDIVALEGVLIKRAEMVITTSDVLKDTLIKKNINTMVVRNACEYDFFSNPPSVTYCDVHNRKIIGYYGAIADWMDLALLEKTALFFNDCLLLLVGADTCGAKTSLAHLPNIIFTGEVSYEHLPFYLYAMDVCLLPFKVMPLTLATNPVKIYEYLSAGKPVVSIELPELAQFQRLVRVAASHDSFIAHIKAVIEISIDTEIEQRKSFASQHTWSHRIAEVEAIFKSLPNPLVSIVVVTYNNIELTKKCLHSIEMHVGDDNIEVIVVDNASTDETSIFLKAWVDEGDSRYVIFNKDNRGFSAANNQGMKKSTGEYLVLLNNDTEVTSGWVRTLLNHFLADERIGMIGPVTNNIGNEARIKINAKNMDAMYSRAKKYTLLHMGEQFSIRTLAFFCVMMRRAVYETVGELDEIYGLGFFEDDDYCRRVEHSGWRIACADDVFVYHQLSASFDKLGSERKALFEKNRQLYESKWGLWEPHQYR